MWWHFFSLMIRSWEAFTKASGTTTLGLSLFAIAIPAATGTIAAIYFRLRLKRPLGEVIAESIRPTLFALGAVFVVTLFGYGWFVILTVYTDHVDFAQQNTQLNKQLNQLLHKNEPHKISRNGPEFSSFVNGVMAFMFISNPKWQLDAQQRCPVRITAPRENEDAAYVIQAMAVSAGCHVPSPENPDMHPDLEKEALVGAERDIVLIRMAKGDGSRDGFVTGMGNIFTVRRSYDLPVGSPPNLVWIQIGNGYVWRKTR